MGFGAFQILAFRTGVDILEVTTPVKFRTLAREACGNLCVLAAHGAEADYVRGALS